MRHRLAFPRTSIVFASWTIAWLSLLAVAGDAVAQPGPEDSDDTAELRTLLKSLVDKIDRLETEKNGDARVTQIGGGSPRARDEERMVLRIYDLSDLFTVAPAYPARHPERPLTDLIFPAPVSASDSATMGGGFGGGMGGGGFFALGNAPAGKRGSSREKPEKIEFSPPQLKQIVDMSGQDTRASMDDLIDTITSTIMPESWSDVGGPASISALGNALVVSASEPAHVQVAGLLDLFRKRWGSLRTVSTQAWWIWATDAELRQGLAPAAGGNPVFGRVTPQWWSKQLAKTEKTEGKDKRAGYQAVVTCYNGQTVYTVAGGRRTILHSLYPSMTDSKKAELYEPTVAVIDEGAALQVTPLTNTSGKYVVLDIHSRVQRLAEPLTETRLPRPEGESAESTVAQLASAIDRPHLLSQRLSTTLRVPAETVMLVGGMSFDSDPRVGDENLYLFVKVTVQELRDDVGPAPTVKKEE